MKSTPQLNVRSISSPLILPALRIYLNIFNIFILGKSILAQRLSGITLPRLPSILSVVNSRQISYTQR